MDISTDPAVEWADGVPDDGSADRWDDERAADPDDDLVDAEFTRRRPGWVTFALAAAIIAGIGFTGGALVQRSYGATATGTPSGMRAQGTPGGAGMAAGEGFPGAGGMPGAAGGMPTGMPSAATGGNSAGTTAGGGSASGSTSASAAPVVVGSVTAVGSGTLTVKNLGGTSVVVKVGSGVPVTVYGLGTTLKVGVLVSVTGSKGTDGSVTATSVTARPA